MSAASWLDDNNRYLAASLRWLRLRLQQQASPASGLDVQPAAQSSLRGRSWFGLNGSSNFAPAANQPSAASNSAATGAALAQALAEREAAARVDPLPALLLLSECLGLSEFERDTLLLCAAAELDPDTSTRCAAAQGNPARTYPTFALALQLFDEPSWDALSPHRPLRYARLIEINQPGATPLTASALRADERIVNYLKGLNTLDERLSSLVTPVAATDRAGLSRSQQSAADGILQYLRAAAHESQLPVVQLLGVDAGSKLALASRISAVLDRRLYRLGLEALPTQKAEIENLARLWQRESLLLPVALYLDAESLDACPAELATAFQWFLSHAVGLVFTGLREASSRVSGSSQAIEVLKPIALEQRETWLDLLRPEIGEEEAARVAQRLACQFNLSLQDIHQAHEVAAIGTDTIAMPQRIWNACRKATQPRLDVLAQRLDPKATWDDLVLSEESLNLLRQIVAHVRGRYIVYEDWGYARKLTRGLGISALFAGESGTGKTMAAEVIANELQLALYRIDLSAVVSKYIGETEKNLRKLFDAAEQGGAILLFDEADALFGKRSEVKDSHDRYANIEINYLLQRMEAFSGLAILATNMKSALDGAFMRRLRFIVNFQFPGVIERAQIWQKALPPEVPHEALVYERLARFSLSGGNIHSIALNAAFSAAQRGSPVTMPLLMSATRTELRKLDKPVNEAEFR
jgi:hypothetical protein